MRREAGPRYCPSCYYILPHTVESNFITVCSVRNFVVQHPRVFRTLHTTPSSPVPLGHVTTRRPGYLTKSSLRFQRNLMLTQTLFWGLLLLILSNVILTYMLILFPDII